MPEQNPGAQFAAAPAPEEESAGGMSVTQIVTILRCYWIHSVVAVVGLMCLTFVVVKLLPKSYVATATMIFNYENKDVLAGREFPAGGAMQAYVPTQIELILSRVVLQPVVDRLKLASDPQYARGFVGTPAALNEVVVNNLRDTLQVLPGTGGQLLYVSAASKSPERAAELANAVADEYLRQERQRTNEPAVERAQRYSQQLQELREKSIQAQDRVTEFRQQHNLTEISLSDGDPEGSTLHDLQEKLQSAQNERRDLESRRIGTDTSPEAVLDSGRIPALRATLTTQEEQMAGLRSTLGAKHPKVVELQSQMDATRQELANELKSLSANNSAQLSRVRSLEEKYEAALEAERTRLLDRRGLQDQGTKLLLELQSAQSNYKRALDGYDEVMFATAGNYKDVTLISRADPPAKPSKPNKMKLFLMGCAMSFGLGLVGPFAYELFLNRRLRCRDDFERHFGVPVLVQLNREPALQA